MARDSAVLDHVLDVLRTVLDDVQARAMFGGHGLYHLGVMFALIADDELYLKADPVSEPRFREAGCRPFTYEGKGKPVTMSYWTVPAGSLDDPDEMRPWAILAVEAAMRGKARKRSP